MVSLISVICALLVMVVEGAMAFPVAVIVMKAWSYISIAFNAPALGYWACYFITWAFLLLFTPTGSITKKEDD